MRIYVTGGAGFVGSNLVHVFADRHGAEVTAPGHQEVDLTDRRRVADSITAPRPEVIVHAAIWNDPVGLTLDRGRAWREYVEATRNVVAAANAVGAHLVLISTDWVFDGTQGLAREDEPPNPVNAYGFLKAASELVVTERAHRGAVARISGVQGVHRTRAELPRAQDAGFGYLVASLLDALKDGRRFTVWDGPGLNRLATPILATDAAELIWRAIELEATGILHCCGGEGIDRVSLARRAVHAFGLDPELLEVGSPPEAITASGTAVPVDTRLDGAATAAALATQLPTIDGLLERLKTELFEITEAVTCPS